MNGAPAFQFYPADWLADERVSIMTLLQEGAYIRAICFCWREGSIPSDSKALARLLGKAGEMPSEEDIEIVKGCFRVAIDPTRLFHPRLEEERIKQKEWSEGQSEAGKRGAEKRWGNRKGKGKDSDPITDPNRHPNKLATKTPLGSDASSPSSSSLKDPPISPFEKSSGKENQAAELYTTSHPVVESVFQSYPRLRRKGNVIFPVRVGLDAREEIAEFMNARPDYPLQEAVTLLRDALDMPPDLSNFLKAPWDLQSLRDAAKARAPAKEKNGVRDKLYDFEAALKRQEKVSDGLDQEELERQAREVEERTGLKVSFYREGEEDE